MKINKLLILMTLLMAGCTTTAQRLSQSDSKLDGLPEVYAKLEQQDGRYTFTEFSMTRPIASPFISLNTLQPVFETSNNSCQTSSLIDEGSADRLCDSEGPFFRQSTLNGKDLVTNTLGNTMLVAMTWGLGSVAVAGYYTTSFDVAAYQEALEQALIGFDRMQFIQDVNSIITRQNHYQEQLRQQLARSRETVHKNIQVKLKDKSGLYHGLPQKPTTRVTTDFMAKVESFYPSRFTTLAQFEQELHKRIGAQTEQVGFALRCEPLPDWNYSTQGCDQSWGFATAATSEPVLYTIASKKALRLYPRPLLANATIKIDTSPEGDLVATNLTEKYLHIDSVSLYLQKDIESVKGNWDLAPNAYVTLASVERFQSYRKHTRLTDVTSQSLKKPFSFGLAAKYKVVDTNREHTLYKKHNKLMKELAL